MAQWLRTHPSLAEDSDSVPTLTWYLQLPVIEARGSTSLSWSLWILYSGVHTHTQTCMHIHNQKCNLSKKRPILLSISELLREWTCMVCSHGGWLFSPSVILWEFLLWGQNILMWLQPPVEGHLTFESYYNYQEQNCYKCVVVCLWNVSQRPMGLRCGPLGVDRARNRWSMKLERWLGS